MRLKRWLNRSRYDRLKMIYIRYVSITLIMLIYGWLRTDWQIIRSTCRDLSSVSRVILTNANCHQAAKQRVQLPLATFIYNNIYKNKIDPSSNSPGWSQSGN